MTTVPNAIERLPKITTAWVGCTSVTDDRETTDDRQTDGRATAYSERELSEREREFPSLKSVCNISKLLCNDLHKNNPSSVYHFILYCSFYCRNKVLIDFYRVRYRTARGVCGKMVGLLAIQNQRYIWNVAVYSQSYYTVSTENRVWPIDWWQIWTPRVNFGILFRGAKFFHNGHLAQFLSERDEIWQVASWSIQPFGHNRRASKIGGTVLFWEGAGSPSNTVAWAEAYLHTKCHLDACCRLATIKMGQKLGALPLFFGGGS